MQARVAEVSPLDPVILLRTDWAFLSLPKAFVFIGTGTKLAQ